MGNTGLSNSNEKISRIVPQNFWNYSASFRERCHLSLLVAHSRTGACCIFAQHTSIISFVVLACLTVWKLAAELPRRHDLNTINIFSLHLSNGCHQTSESVTID